MVHLKSSLNQIFPVFLELRNPTPRPSLHRDEDFHFSKIYLEAQILGVEVEGLQHIKKPYGVSWPNAECMNNC